MTKEQLDMYEELSNAVDSEEQKLTDAVGQLCGIGMETGERVSQYITRLEEAINKVNLQKVYLAAAKAAKKDFLRAV